MSTRALDLLIHGVAGGLHEPTDKRVRVVHHGHTVADTTRALLVWEPRRLVASYAVPADDVHADLVPAETDPNGIDPDELPMLHPGIPFAVHTAPGESLTVRTPAGRVEAAAFRPSDPELAGYVILDFFSFDEWYEEDERIYGHPRDPFHRIDVRRSTRHVRVEVDGHVLAESSRPHILFESGLPMRFYLPREDVRTELLRPTSTRTRCAYKGEAAYWSIELPDRTLEDCVWSYERPEGDASPVAGLLAFFDERVDVVLDGVRRPRPDTAFAEVGFQDGTKRSNSFVT
jgi:uncharacterized protein (DUF427 family)